jgi:hypothetical protein
LTELSVRTERGIGLGGSVIDAINAAIKKNDENQKDWKIILLIIFSVAQGVNLLTVFFWLNTFNIKYDIFFDFDFFPGDMLDGFLSRPLAQASACANNIAQASVCAININIRFNVF